MRTVSSVFLFFKSQVFSISAKTGFNFSPVSQLPPTRLPFMLIFMLPSLVFMSMSLVIVSLVRVCLPLPVVPSLQLIFHVEPLGMYFKSVTLQFLSTPAGSPSSFSGKHSLEVWAGMVMPMPSMAEVSSQNSPGAARALKASNNQKELGKAH